MVWLKYRKSNGYVETITADEPIVDGIEYGKVSNNDYKVGDEITYHITVMPQQDGTHLTASIRQAPAAIDIMQRINNIERASGIGSTEQKGIAQRIDKLEEDIAAIKLKIGL
jgi:hypothetical protein